MRFLVIQARVIEQSDNMLVPELAVERNRLAIEAMERITVLPVQDLQSDGASRGSFDRAEDLAEAAGTRSRDRRVIA